MTFPSRPGVVPGEQYLDTYLLVLCFGADPCALFTSYSAVAQYGFLPNKALQLKISKGNSIPWHQSGALPVLPGYRRYTIAVGCSSDGTVLANLLIQQCLIENPSG
jgi:hypothetical protein